MFLSYKPHPAVIEEVTFIKKQERLPELRLLKQFVITNRIMRVRNFVTEKIVICITKDMTETET